MSWQATLAHGIVRRLPKGKDPVTNGAQLRAHIDKVRANPPKIPQLKGVAVSSSTRDGMTVYEIAPEDGGTDRTVIYLHGGAYLFTASPLHWKFCRRLARTTRSRIIFPLYPLAPESSARVTVEAVASLVRQIQATSGPATIIGDSAGGGLALAVAQQLRDGGDIQPSRLILIAPWLDVTVSDPVQRQIEPRDIMLNVEILQEAGRIYANDLPVHDPRVSPLHGSMEGLPPIDVFVGTDDLLIVDARAAAEKASSAGVRFNVTEAPKMQHVYPLLPLLPESKQARELIAGLVLQTAASV